MKTVTVKSGQSLLDIAIQEKGTLECILELASLNGLSITDDLTAGMELMVPSETYNKLLETYCKKNDVRPATALTYDALRAMWKGGIGYMHVGVDFTIG